MSAARSGSGTPEPETVTDADFEQVVLGSEIPVVVDYWAPWCAPCLMLAPTMEVLASELRGHLTIAEVNIDENQGSAPHGLTTLNIRGIPTLVLYSNGPSRFTWLGPQQPRRSADC
jgi:thioredoxin 1